MYSETIQKPVLTAISRKTQVVAEKLHKRDGTEPVFLFLRSLPHFGLLVLVRGAADGDPSEVKEAMKVAYLPEDILSPKDVPFSCPCIRRSCWTKASLTSRDARIPQCRIVVPHWLNIYSYGSIRSCTLWLQAR